MLCNLQLATCNINFPFAICNLYFALRGEDLKVSSICSTSELDNIPFTEIKSYHWEQLSPYRPKTLFKLAFLRREGFYCVLKCYEENPRAVFTENDSPVFRDSCVEFFLAPVEGREEYINIECNSLAVSLCEFGKGRQNRLLVSSLCEERPEVTAFSGCDESGKFWGVNIFVSLSLISKLFAVPPEKLSFNNFRANIYKCGDETDIPHYIAFSPVTSPALGFHNPSCFFDFTLIERAYFFEGRN